MHQKPAYHGHFTQKTNKLPNFPASPTKSPRLHLHSWGWSRFWAKVVGRTSHGVYPVNSPRAGMQQGSAGSGGCVKSL